MKKQTIFYRLVYDATSYAPENFKGDDALKMARQRAVSRLKDGPNLFKITETAEPLNIIEKVPCAHQFIFEGSAHQFCKLCGAVNPNWR